MENLTNQEKVQSLLENQAHELSRRPERTSFENLVHRKFIEFLLLFMTQATNFDEFRWFFGKQIHDNLLKR